MWFSDYGWVLGRVVYRIVLPPTFSRICNVFRTVFLRKFVRDSNAVIGYTSITWGGPNVWGMTILIFVDRKEKFWGIWLFLMWRPMELMKIWATNIPTFQKSSYYCVWYLCSYGLMVVRIVMYYLDHLHINYAIISVQKITLCSRLCNHISEGGVKLYRNSKITTIMQITL